MRLNTPRTPAPGGGVEPALHLDFLSSDEFRGMGGSLLPAATPPVCDNGLTVNGAQYARVRKNFIMPASITLYCEFLPTFNWDFNAQLAFIDGDAGGTRTLLFKNNNGSGNILSFTQGAFGATVASADYSALWRLNQRNKICVRAVSGGCVAYLNGSALVTPNFGGAAPAQADYLTIGADFTGASLFRGTFYDMRIYTRMITAAEAIELTTLT